MKAGEGKHRVCIEIMDQRFLWCRRDGIFDVDVG